MKRMLALSLIGAFCLGNLTGCAQREEAGNEQENEQEQEMEQADEPEEEETVEKKYLGEGIDNVHLFPTSEAGFVGDPMPYYEDGVFHVFYLEDLRDGKLGYHPWSLYETGNFYEYEYRGQVIPYGDSAQAQDIALGTGSVIKDQNGTYHAFYTGHNDHFQPKEAVMHATSGDLLNWTKIPEDTLFAGDHYPDVDFRDPYVLYVEEEDRYWMLVTTRNERTGIIAKYTSDDLSTWTDEGVFFENDMESDSNMECPSLLKYGEKWYLSFSDQWPDRQWHYRVSDAVTGPFEIPAQDVADCNGFYAGRLETDGENLYLFGWNATKEQHFDGEAYNWAGNLVTHQLVQADNGDLFPVLNTSIKEKMNHELPLSPTMMTETIRQEDDTFIYSGEKYEVVELGKLRGSYLFQTTIRDFKDGERFGFAFNTDKDAVGALNILFNMEENAIAFYNTDEIDNSDPQSKLAFDLENAEELDVSILIDNWVVCMYVNDRCAFTTKMYSSQGNSFGMFGINSGIRCENVRIYK